MHKREFIFAFLVATGMTALLLALMSIGCSGVRVSGYERRMSEGPKPDSFSVSASTRPARRRPQDYLPRDITQEQKQTLYYSDLGPDTIDVSQYPAQQKYNYSVYVRACSRCHTLARSINAPTVNRSFWEFYILGMRFNAHFRPGAGMSKEEVNSILDFLEYDSNIRKVQRRSEFDELTDELKRRFQPILQEHLRKLGD